MQLLSNTKGLLLGADRGRVSRQVSYCGDQGVGAGIRATPAGNLLKGPFHRLDSYGSRGPLVKAAYPA